jgi:hypothetical protein
MAVFLIFHLVQFKNCDVFLNIPFNNLTAVTRVHSYCFYSYRRGAGIRQRYTVRQDRGEVRLHPPVNRRPTEKRGAVRLRAGKQAQHDYAAGRTRATGMCSFCS